MRASSPELRQHVLRAVDEGPSRAEIIDLFQVSRATIKRDVKQRRETGTVLLRPIPERPQRKEPRSRQEYRICWKLILVRGCKTLATGGKASMESRSAPAA